LLPSDDMSLVTPTLIPRNPALPLLLPDIPKPHPTPLPPNSGQPPGRLSSRRNLRNEMEDLSDEEDDIEESWKEAISQRGYNFLHVIGRLLTQQEEKNDQAETDTDESGSAHSGGQASNVDDGENGSQPDLDATMEDLDIDAGNAQFESDEADDEIDDIDDEAEL